MPHLDLAPLALARRILPVVAAASAVLVMGAGPARAATTLDLGTAGGFAVLAGSGITNTGVSTISGDTGTSPTPSETGMTACPSAADCVVLTGSDHPADSAALQAKQDLTTAYDTAAGQPADASVSADLGGHTFTAGTYNAASSLGLTGEVTLDAEGVGGAVFIFQAGSSLTTAAGSSIKLVNNASACNVFFQVGSAATLGTGSTFRGTILAHDDISLGDSVLVEGRLLGGEQASGAGAVTLIHDTIHAPDCTTPVVVPPAVVPPVTGGSPVTTPHVALATGGVVVSTGTTGHAAVPPSELPFTGIDVGPLSVVGFGSLAVGLGALALGGPATARQRTRRR